MQNCDALMSSRGVWLKLSIDGEGAGFILQPLFKCSDPKEAFPVERSLPWVLGLIGFFATVIGGRKRIDNRFHANYTTFSAC
jgi:hypothetical protein